MTINVTSFGAGGGISNYQSYTSSDSLVIPGRVYTVYFKMVGGGAGARNQLTESGGAGAFAMGYILTRPGRTLTLTVGAGGAAGGLNDGGDSIIEDDDHVFVICKGGTSGGDGLGGVSPITTPGVILTGGSGEESGNPDSNPLGYGFDINNNDLDSNSIEFFPAAAAESGGSSYYGVGGTDQNDAPATSYGAGGGRNGAGASGIIELWW